MKKIINKLNFKEKKNLIIVILGIILFICFVIGIFLLIGSKQKDKNNSVKKGEHSVKIHVNFLGNLIFSKYDVILSSENQKERLEHGKDKDVIFYFDEGQHTLSFVNAEDNSIKNEITIEVKYNMEITYRISCYKDRIEVKNLYTDIDIPLEENQIKIDFDKSEFSYNNYKNYKDAVDKFQKLGFSNIIEEPVYDIEPWFIENNWTNEGEIKSVKINGTDDYKKGDIFLNDTEIVITYHLRKSDNPTRIKAPYTGYTAYGIDYKEVENAFKEAGFKNITFKTQGLVDISADKKVYDIKIDYMDVIVSQLYEADSKVVIYYYVYEEGIIVEKPTTKPRPGEVELSHYGAKKAFEKYGSAMYRYGFKCHWIKNLIEAEDRADGSIYYKVGVTITNQYNASYEAVAEGIVSGTDANPKVTNFKVK